MKRPILYAGLVFGTLAFGLAGCHQAEKVKAVTKSAKPEDPTSWTDKDVIKGNSDSDFTAMPQSSGIKGAWSSEGRDIERSLGVTR